MAKIGIDVSCHNGVIDWSKVAKQVGFAIIRAGYGKNNIDEKAVYNIMGCKNNNIPFGLYWFSYALDVEMAKAEADYICDLADVYQPTYPICYDWEYDSDSHAKSNNTIINKSTRMQFAKAFLERVEERGYRAMLYTNIDYLNKGFDALRAKYPIWLAQWNTPEPSTHYDIWQYSCHGTLDGIKTKVDMNQSKKDYSKQDEDKQKSFSDFAWNKYMKVAKEIIDGKYGNGEERKKRLNVAGFDYELAQMIVNHNLKR